jgi:hypothetical protein
LILLVGEAACRIADIPLRSPPNDPADGRSPA